METFQATLDTMNLDPTARAAILHAAAAATTTAANIAATAATANPNTATASALAINDELRTIMAVIKPKVPKSHEGNINAEACLNFLESQAEYYSLVKLNRRDWVQYAVLNLDGPALAWWRSTGLKNTISWEQFCPVFKA
ncbi:hypothetical protein BGX26_009589, partial [Mortierella sp. AD094]